MEVYRSLDKIPILPSSVVTIGTFDGCHRGHQEVIKKVVSTAQLMNKKSVLITFNPHPRHILQKGNKLPMLMHVSKKLEILKSLNIDVVILIPFNKEFSNVKADDFLFDVVIKHFKPSSVIIGYDHHFGFERQGSPLFLRDFGKENGFNVDVLEPISDENVVISSTHIRNLIKEGFVRRASFELGWVFGFESKVIEGAGRGKDLGYPTANFVPVEQNQLVPANGVYFIRGRINENNLYGMCNLGIRPTFNETDFVMEVHFFDLMSNDIYGEKITVEFLERIRDEKKFSNPNKLIEQLNKDKQNCISLMQKYN